MMLYVPSVADTRARKGGGGGATAPSIIFERL